MKRSIAFFVAVTAVFGALSMSGVGTFRASAAQDDAERGHQLFVQNGCYECHGYVGQGASSTGPRLAPDPLPYSRFSRIVYDPIDTMPRYTPQFVSEQDLRDIYAYLDSIPPSAPVDDIALLRE